jgi:hypothetical protein
MTLRNPVESLGNVKFPPRHRPATSRIGELVAPGANWRSRASVRGEIKESTSD